MSKNPLVNGYLLVLSEEEAGYAGVDREPWSPIEDHYYARTLPELMLPEICGMHDRRRSLGRDARARHQAALELGRGVDWVRDVVALPRERTSAALEGEQVALHQEVPKAARFTRTQRVPALASVAALASCDAWP